MESEFQTVNQTIFDIVQDGWGYCLDIRIYGDKFINPLCQKIEGLLRSNGSTSNGWLKDAYIYFLSETCLFTEELLVENALRLFWWECDNRRKYFIGNRLIRPQWYWEQQKLDWKNLWNITRKTFIFQANRMVVNIVTDVGINITRFDIVPDKNDVNFHLNFTFLEPNAPEIRLDQATLNRIFLLMNDVSFLAEDYLFNQAGIKAHSDTKPNHHSLIFRRCTFTLYMFDGFIQTENISSTVESCIFSN